MSINRASISGNLTRDPELRVTPSGMQVLGFGVAVTDRRKNNQTGEWEDYPNFVDCTIFGNRGESMGRILHKGMKVAVEGKLRYSAWEDKNGGGRRSKIEVIVDEIELMSQNPNGAHGGQAAPQQYAPQGYQPQAYAPQQAPQPAPQAYAPQPAPQQPAPQWNAQQAYQNPPAVPQRPQQAPAPAPQAYAPQQAPQPAPQPAPQQPAPAQQQLDVYDEDIPF